MMAPFPLRLTLLGGMRVLDPAGADVTPRNRKVRGLIAYLTRTPGGAAGRDRLVGLLWSDRGEAQARASLRQALVDLRETAPGVAPLVVASRLEVALAPDLWTADTREIEAALDLGDVARLTQQMAAVRGAFLADLDGLSPGFDDWLRGERTRFEAALVAGGTAVLQGALDEPALREPARALASALQRLFEDQEEPVRLGMQLDHLAGDLASVHRRYRQLEAHLRREFETEPAPETRRLLAGFVTVAPLEFTPAGGRAHPVLVVSPPEVLGRDPDAEALARVMCLDLEAALNHLPDLRVLTLHRPTPERLARATTDAVAGYALGGTVRTSGSGLRIAFRLVEIGSDRVVWSHTRTAAEADLAGAIDDIVDKVAGAILPTVERDLVHSQRLEGAPAAAYAVYVHGRSQLLAARTYAEARRAADLLEAAADLDAGFVNARLELATCYNTDFIQRIAGHETVPWRRRALELAQACVALEPSSAVARTRLGWCRLRQGEFALAEAEFRSAIALGPHQADVVEAAGCALAILGSAIEGRGLIQRAFELNPFPRSDYFADIGLCHMFEGRLEAAAEQFAIARDPSLNYLTLETACLGLLDHPAAADVLARLHAGFAAIWAGPRPFHPSDARTWFHIFMPLARAEDRALVDRGLQAAETRASSFA